MKEDIMNYEPKFTFGKSCDSLTAHTLLNFIDSNQAISEARHKHVLNNFILDQVNWSKLVYNSQVKHALTEVPGKPKTEFGKPLL